MSYTPQVGDIIRKEFWTKDRVVEVLEIHSQTLTFGNVGFGKITWTWKIYPSESNWVLVHRPNKSQESLVI